MKRPRLPKKIWQILTIFFVVFIGLVTYLFIFSKKNYTVSPQTTYLTSPISSDGYIDYVLAVNKQLRGDITPERNANVLIWKAIGPHPQNEQMPRAYFEWLGIPEPPTEGEYFVDWENFQKTLPHEDQLTQKSKSELHQKQLEFAQQWPWNSGEFPRLAEWINRNKKPLEVFSKAATFSEFYNPIVPGSSMPGENLLIQAKLRSAQACSDAVSILLCRAMLSLGNGKSDLAWADLITCHRLGRLLEQSGTIGELYSSYRLQRKTIRAEQVLLSLARLTPEMIEQCRKDVSQLPRQSTAADKLNMVERLVTLDVIQLFVKEGQVEFDRFFTDMMGDAPKWHLSINRYTDFNSAMIYANRSYDSVVNALKAETFIGFLDEYKILETESKALRVSVVAPGEINEVLNRIKAGETLGKIVITMLLPTYHRVFVEEKKVAQMHLNLDVVLALAAFRFQQGKYPETLADLLPKHLKSKPLDIFTGKDLIYLRNQDGYQFSCDNAINLNDQDQFTSAASFKRDMTMEMPGKEPQRPNTDKIDPEK